MNHKKVLFSGLTRKNACVIKIETEVGNTITLTPDHKVFTSNRGYKQAQDLINSDVLFLLENVNKIKRTRIKKITTVDNADVYDLKNR